MSHFIDPSRERSVDLGDGDTAWIRGELSGSEISVIQSTPEDEIAASEALAPLVLRWSLDRDPTPENLRLLDAPSLTALVNGIQEVIRESGTLPNPSSAPSRGSSRGSASRTRTLSPTPGT